MKKLLILVFKFSIPLLAVLAFYAWLDPFKVIWHYDSFYEANNVLSVPLNKDYVSTSTFDNQYKKEQYNSFIFGNSRSIFYEISEWKKYLPTGSRPYHFDASAETVYGISKKIAYIDGKNQKLDNVLIMLDHMILSRDKSLDGHLFVISPQLTGYENYGTFHLDFLKTFFSHKFLPGYLDYKVSGKVKPYMLEGALTDEAFLYDKKTNEMRHTTAEQQITNGSFYTPERMKVFYKRDSIQTFANQVIVEKQKEYLQQIQQIFKKQNTHYKIIINPLYDQKKLNTEDLAYLKSLFGDNIFDYSGINSITNDYTNYYESSHYRPKAAFKILREIYK